jgi:hypothetical protein
VEAKTAMGEWSPVDMRVASLNTSIILRQAGVVTSGPATVANSGACLSTAFSLAGVQGMVTIDVVIAQPQATALSASRQVLCLCGIVGVFSNKLTPDWLLQVLVLPTRRVEPATLPFVAACASMLFGVTVFSVVFLHNLDTGKLLKHD